LGAQAYPWYPSAQACNTASFADWSPALDAAANAVAGLANERS
jgi:glutaminase